MEPISFTGRFDNSFSLPLRLNSYIKNDDEKHLMLNGFKTFISRIAFPTLWRNFSKEPGVIQAAVIIIIKAIRNTRAHTHTGSERTLNMRSSVAPFYFPFENQRMKTMGSICLSSGWNRIIWIRSFSYSLFPYRILKYQSRGLCFYSHTFVVAAASTHILFIALTARHHRLAHSTFWNAQHFRVSHFELTLHCPLFFSALLGYCCCSWFSALLI